MYTCNSRVQHTHKYTQTEHRCPTETPNGIGNGLIQSLTKLLHEYPFTRSLSHEQTIGSLSCIDLFSYQHHHLLTQSVQLSMCVAVRACVCVCVWPLPHLSYTPLTALNRELMKYSIPTDPEQLILTLIFNISNKVLPELKKSY